MAYKFQLGGATMSGSLTQEGAIVCDTSLTIGNAAMSEADLEKLDGITNGVVAANKAVVVDGNKDVGDFRHILMAGKVGTAPDQEYVDFGTSNEIKFGINNAQEMVLTAGGLGVTNGIQIGAGEDLDTAGAGASSLFASAGANNVTIGGSTSTVVIPGNLTVTGTTVEIDAAFVVTSSVQFEGITPDGNEISLTSADPTADRTITLPDLSGHVPLIAGAATAASIAVTAAEFALLDGASTVGTTALADADGFMHNDDGTMKQTQVVKIAELAFSKISSDATVASNGALTIADNAVSLAKMAGLAAGKFILGDSNGDPAAVTLSGDATVSNAGVITIAADAIHDSMVNDDVATGLAGSGLAAASGVMSLDLHELTAETIAAGDFLPFVDSTDNGTHKETVDDLASLFAGAGLAASSAVLAVQVSGAVLIASDKVGISGSFAGNGINYAGGVDSISSITIDADPDSFSVSGAGLQLAANVAGAGIGLASGQLSLDIDELGALGGTGVADSDAFAFSDNGTEKKLVFSNLYGAVFGKVSGDATVAAGGALTIAAGAVEHGMLAEDIISGQAELAHADIVDADELMISDGGVIKRVGVDSLRDHYFGVVSGDATIADGGALTIAADAVEPSMMNIFDDSLAATDTHFMIADGTDYSSFALSGDVTCTNAGVVTIAAGAVEEGMLNDNIISGQAELAAGGVADADELLISDGGTLKRIGVDSFAAYTQQLVRNAIGDANGTLVAGVNYASADTSAARTWTLPASPALGDSVKVKAAGLSGGAITIARAGSQTIDGSNTSIILESDNAAVELIYVAADDWRVF